MILVCAILLFALSLTANLAIDYREILTKGKVDHTSKWPWIRKALISLPSVLFFSWELSDDVKWVWCLVFSGLMGGFVFMLFFDPLLNLLRGYGILYSGTKDEYDSSTEKLERSLPIWLVWTIKILLAFASVYLYIQMI